MPMQGLNFRSIKKHPSLIPLYVAVGCGCVGAMMFIVRSATRNPDVSWNKKENPEPWQEYSNKQYKFLATRDDNTSKAPKYHE